MDKRVFAVAAILLAFSFAVSRVHDFYIEHFPFANVGECVNIKCDNETSPWFSGGIVGKIILNDSDSLGSVIGIKIPEIHNSGFDYEIFMPYRDQRRCHARKVSCDE